MTQKQVLLAKNSSLTVRWHENVFSVVHTHKADSLRWPSGSLVVAVLPVARVLIPEGGFQMFSLRSQSLLSLFPAEMRPHTHF